MMAHVEVDGLGTLIDDLEMLQNLPEEMMEDMLNAGADVLVRFQRAEIKQLWSGPYSMKISARAIKKDVKIRTSKYIGISGRYINIYPQGTRKRGKKRARNAEIAFINEYGAPKRGVEPRPAIGIANEKGGQQAVEAAEQVYHAYLDSKGL